MFVMADLITAAVIKDGLEHLAANPDHCRFILGGFQTGIAAQFVNHDHINQAVEFVTKNQINISPYYENDIKKRPSVSIVSSGSESTQFIGDYGREGLKEAVMSPIIYARFDIKSYDGDTMSVPRGLKLENSLWPNQILTNGQDTVRLKGIQVKEDQDTVLFLDKVLTAGTSLKGWQAQSLTRAKGYVINSSSDKITVQVQLVTTGFASVHRLLAVIIRYCLKRGRMLFDNAGMQIPTFSYTPLMLNDDTELEYQSVFTIESTATDSWIESEYDLNDNTKKFVIDIDAVPTDKVRDDEVDLG